MRAGSPARCGCLSNTNALTEFLPETLSSFPDGLSRHQRRSRGAAERRDRRPDRGRQRRYRHRRRHRRSRRPAHVSVSQRPFRAGGREKSSARQPLAHRLCRGARLRHGRARPRQRDPALPRRQGQPHRPAVAAARAAAQLRRDLPPGRMQCRRRHRAGDDGAAHRAQHGDQRGASDRFLGVARIDDLRARRRRVAALCAAAGRSSARPSCI